MDSDCQLHSSSCVTCDCWQAITAFRVAYQLRREILVFQGLVEAYLSVGKVRLLPVLISLCTTADVRLSRQPCRTLSLSSHFSAADILSISLALRCILTVNYVSVLSFSALTLRTL